MSTIVTRSLGGNDNYDRQAVKVDSSAYAAKWGVIEVTLTNYITAGSGTLGGNVDVRSPNYNVENDDIFVNNTAIGTSGATTSITKKAYIAVNNGVVGPSALVNPDGTWDLLWLTYTQAANNAQTNTNVTLTYTIAFTDLTPSTTNPSNTGTLSLSLDNVKVKDKAYVGIAASSLSGLNGRVTAQINSLAITSIDKPLSQVTNINPNVPYGAMGDSVPVFTVMNEKSDGNVFTIQGVLISHPTSKVSGTKTYVQQFMVFAVNAGKIDGNAKNVNMTNPQALTLRCALEKLPDWPCDDTVTATIGYTIGFTSM
jgi:hypothetical protein